MRNRAVIAAGVVAAVAGLAFGPSARAASPLCNAGERATLDAAAAAGVPAVENDHLTSFGISRAQQQAAALIEPVNACSVAPSPATARALAKIDRLLARGDKAGAKRLLRATFQLTRNRRDTQSASRTAAPRAVLSHCPDQSPHLSLKGIPGVFDNLALAKKAFDLKDLATGEAAVAAARAAYAAWVQAGAGGATTVGDWLAVKTAAIQLGVAAAATVSQDRAQARALADLKTAEQADPCTVTKNDYDCWVKMLATVQMVGADPGDDLAGARKLGKAIEDRIQHIAPEGCEEWSFQMTIAFQFSTGSLWQVKYPTGTFRVDRQAGTLDGSYEAGLVGGGYPGLIGSATAECIETTPDGTTDLGPATIQPGTFHYTFSGSADASSIEVTASSSDANISMTLPSDPGCQFLGDLAQQVLGSLVQTGIPLDFATPPTQDTATFSWDDGQGSTISATITRRPLVQP